jgi:hypothetical protein
MATACATARSEHAEPSTATKISGLVNCVARVSGFGFA